MFSFCFQNVEDDYLPRVNKDDNKNDDDNGSTILSSNELIKKRSNDTNDEENCQQHQKPIYSQNDEVYI